MANYFIGRIVELTKVENVGKKKPFFKRTFVLDDSLDPKYPNPVQFELTGDKVDLLGTHAIGDEIRVKFYLNGRKWHDPKTDNDRYFVSLRAVEIDDDSDGAAQPTEQPPEAGSGEDAAEPTVDDLPF